MSNVAPASSPVLAPVVVETARGHLDLPYKLTAEAIRHFREKGYVKLKQVLSPEVIEYYGKEITRQVIALNRQQKPLAERDTYGKAFLQIGNIWTHSEIVKEFSFSKRLARIAAELMGVKGVRMYHDQALYKEPSGGFTPWHADQFYWPLSNPNTCTVWAPLQQTPLEMGALAFAAGSHKSDCGRDLEISDDSEKLISEKMQAMNFPYEVGPFDLGEVSYHYGWCFHRAGANTTDKCRSVMTIIYMEDGIRVAQPKNKAQENDWKGCLPGTKIGEIADSPINPVLYRAQ
jgi:ectoine hydroxylase-related dioxygenase (phytanoyl-CoA dioxygenase family)